MTFEETEKIDDKIVEILIEHGPDGHCDGHEILTEYVVNLLKQTRQETLREVIPVLEKAVQHWGDYAPQRTNARQTLDEAKDLLKKLEAEREG